MEQLNSKIIRNEAGIAALIFGAVSGGYVILEYGLYDFFLAHSWISSILGLAKFAGLIFLMSHLMKRLMANYEGVGTRELRSYGRLIAFYSAIITALCAYLASSVLFPGIIQQTMDTVYQTMGSSLDANSRAAMQVLEQSFGTILMISQLLYCTIYGILLSAILSRALTAKSSPFDSEEDI